MVEVIERIKREVAPNPTPLEIRSLRRMDMSRHRTVPTQDCWYPWDGRGTPRTLAVDQC